MAFTSTTINQPAFFPFLGFKTQTNWSPLLQWSTGSPPRFVFFSHRPPRCVVFANRWKNRKPKSENAQGDFDWAVWHADGTWSRDDLHQFHQATSEPGQFEHVTAGLFFWVLYYLWGKCFCDVLGTLFCFAFEGGYILILGWSCEVTDMGLSKLIQLILLDVQYLCSYPICSSFP